MNRRSFLLAFALAGSLASGAAAGPEGAVTLSLRKVPLREALARLYQGTGLRVEVEPAVPEAPVSAELRDVPRALALRTLLRATGLSGLGARETPSPSGSPEQGCSA